MLKQALVFGLQATITLYKNRKQKTIYYLIKSMSHKNYWMNYFNLEMVCYLILVSLLCWIVQSTLAVSSCDSSNEHPPSLYEQYCCVKSNLGETIILTGEHIRTYIMCPLELPSTCLFVRLIYSCSHILAHDPTAPSGYYNIRVSNGTITTVYCDMDLNCNGERSWMRVGYLNMTDPNEQCPPGFRLHEQNGVRACGRYTIGCLSVTYPSHDISYSQVCGRVIGYQRGATLAIVNQQYGIDGAYVDGVSITRGYPRQHIWTFMAATQENSLYSHGHYDCPCSPNSPATPASFIGNDYFCESGNPVTVDFTTFHYADPLWDGKQCGLIEKVCCNAPGIPWFHKPLQQPTTDYIELRVCSSSLIIYEDIPVSLVEIYTG